MSEDLQNEIQAINSIYGEESLVSANDEDVYILHLPQQSASLRIRFPLEYPSAPPVVLGIESSGELTRKGDAAHVADIFRDMLGKLYQPGEVCLFDVIEEVNSKLGRAVRPTFEEGQEEGEEGEGEGGGGGKQADPPEKQALIEQSKSGTVEIEPPWTLSDVIIELKSVFIARSAPISSLDQAKRYLQHLLDSDKKVRSATHNITAWRIKGENGVAFQDCDDDGETAAGGRVLHLMQLMDVWNVMVVVTRWYGGHQLGPKRFSIINIVARDALVKGGFLKDETSTKNKGKR